MATGAEQHGYGAPVAGFFSVFFRGKAMSVIERGTDVYRLALLQAPDYPPITISERGLVDTVIM